MENRSRKKDMHIYYRVLKFVKQTDKSTQNRVISKKSEPYGLITYISMR